MAQKLTALKSKLSTAPDRLRTLPNTTPSATPRQRGRAWMDRRGRWLRLHPLCKHCEEETPPRITMGEEVDHIIPLHQGGADDETNFQTLCKQHHKAKTAAELSRSGDYSRPSQDATTPQIPALAPFWQSGVPSSGG